MRIGLQTWGSEGDIRPVLALAAGLSSRGHTVTMVVTGQLHAEHATMAARHGVSIRMTPVPGLDDQETLDDLMASWVAESNPLRQARMILEAAVDPAVPAMTEVARDLCRASDIVVAHFFVHPLLAVAERQDVPCAVLHLAHTGLPSREIRPPGFPALGRLGNRLGWAATRHVINRLFRPRINQSRAAEGLQPIDDVMRDAWASSSLTLLAVSPRIRPRPEDWPSSHQVCGFLELPDDAAPMAVDAELEAFLEAGPAPAYFTFGSLLPRGPARAGLVAETWRDAARRAGCRAILQLPPWAGHGPQDDGRVFVVQRAPHARVFPRCAAVVHHGGAGTLHATLTAGVPSVVVPHVADQFFWAGELRRIGVAGPVVPRRRLGASRLADALTRTLANPRLAEAARELRRHLSHERGVDLACALIEETCHA